MLVAGNNRTPLLPTQSIRKSVKQPSYFNKGDRLTPNRSFDECCC
jgi:hypothetical protein